MKREDVIQLAREATKQEPREDWNSTAWVLGDEALEHFAKAVEQRTLERAAQTCNELAELNREKPTDSMWQWEECAAAIRALGEKA